MNLVFPTLDEYLTIKDRINKALLTTKFEASVVGNYRTTFFWSWSHPSSDDFIFAGPGPGPDFLKHTPIFNYVYFLGVGVGVLFLIQLTPTP